MNVNNHFCFAFFQIVYPMASYKSAPPVLPNSKGVTADGFQNTTSILGTELNISAESLAITGVAP